MPRAVLDFPIGGGSPRPAWRRGDWLVHHADGWANFVDRWAEPALELGWDAILLHLPYGRTVTEDGDFVRPMEFDQLWKAGWDHYLVAGFESAWKPFIERHRRDDVPWGPVTAYVGDYSDCERLNQYRRAEKFGTAMVYESMAVHDLLDAGCDLWLDAALSTFEQDEVIPVGEDSAVHTFIRHVQAMGTYVGIEPHPFKEQAWAFDLPVYTEFEYWQKAWKKEREALTGEILMAAGVKLAQREMSEFVARHRERIAQYEPGWSVLIERGDRVVDEKLTPADFGWKG